MSYLTVEAEVNVDDVIAELSDEALIAECMRRKLKPYRPASGDPYEYPPSTAASIFTMDQLRQKCRLLGDRQ